VSRLPIWFAAPGFAGFVAALVASSGHPRPEVRAEDGRKPDVVLIVVDDVGLEQLRVYDDVNQYERDYPYARTPTIERLAAEGVRFTQCRATPLCSSTRAAILTGRYPFRTGIGSLVSPDRATGSARGLGDPEPEVTLAHRLRAAGYSTALVGKSHLEVEPPVYADAEGHVDPLGFDFRSGTHGNIAGGPDNPPVDGVGPGFWNFVWVEQGQAAQVTGHYVTTYTREKAQAWIERAGEGPWFLCLSFHACHRAAYPHSWPPEALHGFGPRPAATYWNTFLRASLEALDTELGRFLGWLDAEHPGTVVLLVADNGTAGEALVSRAGEVRYPREHPSWKPGDQLAGFSLAPYENQRGKGGVYETGIRVPLIVRAPGLAPGSVTDALVDEVDLFATILEVAGLSSEAEDSIGFWGRLTDAGGPQRTFSYSETFKPNTKRLSERESSGWSFVHVADGESWKLVGSSPGRAPELYCISRDPLELDELGPRHEMYAATVEAMRAVLPDLAPAKSGD